MDTFNWYHLKKWHYGNIELVLHQDDETIIFHYSTETTLAGNMTPMVKVNKLNNLVYFSTERSTNGDFPYPEFETRGHKCVIC